MKILTDSFKIAARIKEVRTFYKITQQDVSDVTGIARNNVSRIESGKSLPSLETLSRIAMALDVPLSRLLIESVDE